MLYPQDWLTQFHDDSLNDKFRLSDIYGNDLRLIKERKIALSKIVSEFSRIFGSDQLCSISRAPGRVNLMGRHIDHQGGYINTIAINKEILIAFSPRIDHKVVIKNSDENSYSPRELIPHSLLDFLSYDCWEKMVNSPKVKELNKNITGDWSLYILAVYTRIQYQFKGKQLNGLDCCVSGNIPAASGLSSSAALGVAFANALLQVNNLQLSNKLLIELIGESKLFVGFMGGIGDQAAIISGRLGYINKIGLYPFHIANQYPFPKDVKIIIAFSGTVAKKGGKAKELYNQRVALVYVYNLDRRGFG